MKANLKRIFVALLALCFTAITIAPVSASTADGNEIMPLYNNTESASGSFTISSTGLSTINYKYYGISGITTKAVITTYIQKKSLGLFWTRVDIGATDDEWVDTINSYSGSKKRTYQLSKTGKYRVTINFKIYGSGGSADEIPRTYEASY